MEVCFVFAQRFSFTVLPTYLCANSEDVYHNVLNIEALSYGTELLLGVLRGYQSKKNSYYFPILGARIPIYSYFLHTAIPIFLIFECHFTLDTLLLIAIERWLEMAFI